MISSTDPLFILPLFIKREKKKTEVLNPQGGKKKKPWRITESKAVDFTEAYFKRKQLVLMSQERNQKSSN